MVDQTTRLKTVDQTTGRDTVDQAIGGRTVDTGKGTPRKRATESSAPRRHQVQLGPMHVPKASDVLADDLRERILRSEYPEGTALPPERELVLQTRMSRTTVREALRILEVQGLVTIKTGRSGGAFVQRPGEESVASSVSLLIRGRHIRMTALHETRAAIEPVCARLAAKNRTDADLARLELANSAMGAEGGSVDDFLEANVDWHVAVARAGHNELLTSFMLALARAIYMSTDNRGFVEPGLRQSTMKAHRAITDAIRSQDDDVAVRRMNRHVHGYAQAVREGEERGEIEPILRPNS